MKKILGLIAATGMLATSAAPLFAATVVGDPMTTSCGDFLAQGDTDRMSLAMQYGAYTMMSETDKAAVEAMTDEQKAALITDAQAKRAAMSAEDMAKETEMGTNWLQKIIDNCKASPEKNVVDAMDAAM